MNIARLKKAEAEFLCRYPQGFSDPEMIAIGKKHKMPKMIESTQLKFSGDNFVHVDVVVDNLLKTICQSSMVSMFEKPKFREFAKTLNVEEKEMLVDGLQERLHGDAQQGFDMLLGLLQTRKLAKWSLISICPVYFNPDYDVFVKPTTAKSIINVLDLQKLHYKPMPSWEFYDEFRDQINLMKTKVDASLSPNSAAFTGFLMMSL